MDSNTKTEDPSRFQRNSWEIEILISGGAFFAVYQLSSTLYAFTIKLDTDSVFFGGSILMFTVIALRILSIYFGIHLCVRAFWLSLVLLKKIYPQGINAANFSLVEPYKSITNKFNLDQRIAYTDKLSGLIFSWAVTFAIALFGVSLALSVSLTILFSAIKINPELGTFVWWRITLSMVYLSFLLFLLDTFFYGILRRSKISAKLFYPIYIFWSTISLSFLWRPSLQIIFTNVRSKWKTSLIVSLVTVVIVFMTGDEDDFMKIFNSRKHVAERIISEETRYLDRRTDETKAEQGGSFIQSDVIKDNFLKIFVNYNEFDDKHVDSLKTDEKYFSRIIILSINDSILATPSWIGLNRINGQKGIQAVIDISHLKNRMHVLKIRRNYDKDPLVIPFWKQ